MSKTVKVSLTSSKSKKALSLDDKFISLGKGECIFPFNYNDTKYNECYPGKKGDWCATEVYPTGNMKKYAYCDYSSNSPTNNKSKKLNKKDCEKESQDLNSVKTEQKQLKKIFDDCKKKDYHDHAFKPMSLKDLLINSDIKEKLDEVFSKRGDFLNYLNNKS